jgi:hypothetical protein
MAEMKLPEWLEREAEEWANTQDPPNLSNPPGEIVSMRNVHLFLGYKAGALAVLERLEKTIEKYPYIHQCNSCSSDLFNEGRESIRREVLE